MPHNATRSQVAKMSRPKKLALLVIVLVAIVAAGWLGASCG